MANTYVALNVLPYKIVKGSSVPSSGTWAVGDRIINSVPSPGATSEWECITAGTANEVPWAQSTAYVLNQTVYANGNVYRCSTAGTSNASGTGPSASTGSSIVDGGGALRWAFVDKRAVFIAKDLLSLS